MTAASERPLVTFAVIAYNQERYIREAIEGAFAQTYQPLEIILSDDCSPDRTFEIMQEMAAAYTGPHKVVLNRNERNLGVVPHIDRVMAMVSGEFIVVNAGDDTSVPERTEKLASAWLESNRRAKLIHSAARRMGSMGELMEIARPPERTIRSPTATTIICKQSHIFGATAAWDREVYSEFGPLGADLSIEDRILPFRAALLGEIAYLDEPLVNYRIGGISSFTAELTAHDYLYGMPHRLRKWMLEIDLYVLKRFSDLDYPDKLEIEETCRKRAQILKLHVDLAEAGHKQRFGLAPRAFGLAIRIRSITPIKHWVRYSFDQIYIPLSDLKNGRRPSTGLPATHRTHG